MKNAISKTILDKDDDDAIQTIAERVGNEIRQSFAYSLGEILLLIRDKERHATMELSVHQDEFLTASELAKILKISKALVYRMIQIKEIPSFSIGRTVRVRRDDLDTFIESHMTKKERS